MWVLFSTLMTVSQVHSNIHLRFGDKRTQTIDCYKYYLETAGKKMKSMKDMTREEKEAFLKERAEARLERGREQRRKQEALQ